MISAINGASLTKALRVGTRDSQLARLQTDAVIEALATKYPELIFEIVPITASGDKILDRPIADIGGRGVFVKELEEALYENRVDFVVHSLKDLPTDMPDNLVLASVLHRTDARDVLVSYGAVEFANLPRQTKIATSSRRRAAQLKALRADLDFCDIRGNIPTRIRKFEEGQCQAMILAAAGLLRLGLASHIAQYLEMDICTPAVGQGALAVQCRADDQNTLAYLNTIDDPGTRAQITAERAFLDKLGGGCSVPVGAFAHPAEKGIMTIMGCVAALDGSKVIRTSMQDREQNAHVLGTNLALRMQELGAQEILEDLKQAAPSTISPP